MSGALGSSQNHIPFCARPPTPRRWRSRSLPHEFNSHPRPDPSIRHEWERFSETLLGPRGDRVGGRIVNSPFLYRQWPGGSRREGADALRSSLPRGSARARGPRGDRATLPGRTHLHRLKFGRGVVRGAWRGGGPTTHRTIGASHGRGKDERAADVSRGRVRTGAGGSAVVTPLEGHVARE